MTTLFLILIILACVVLTLIVLVQNPKGGGLAGNVAGLSNQFMGVKQTTDVLEKGTWIFAALIALICLISTPLLRGGKSATNTEHLEGVGNGPLPGNAQKSQNATPYPATTPAKK
jgi:preprotein translocase subunit SecG